MKKRSLKSLAKGIGYSTAVFFNFSNHGRSVSKIGNERP
ncbi:hypothetical protein EDD58_101376 [Hazenella coriacea]|uniref:Uncharacterized protein n=1 Tax=Hazenella coriacea TaxID=1179467 RepID=A0A4R3LBX3_9BACL|nr:hypothetical protein EDD58_101376 [Hazenella coriacea]